MKKGFLIFPVNLRRFDVVSFIIKTVILSFVSPRVGEFCF